METIESSVPGGMLGMGVGIVAASVLGYKTSHLTRLAHSQCGMRSHLC